MENCELRKPGANQRGAALHWQSWFEPPPYSDAQWKYLANDGNFAGSTLYPTIPTDPSDNSLVVFSGSRGLSIGNSYFIFLTADVAANATGEAVPTVNDFSMTNAATKNNFTSGEPMANQNVLLPVSVSSFCVE